MEIPRDDALIKSGEDMLGWVSGYMPLMRELETQLRAKKPLSGKRISISVSLDAKAARFCTVLAAAGAQLMIAGSNPFSTRDEVCAALCARGLDVYGYCGESREEYFEDLKKILSFEPDLFIDEGGDCLSLLHGELASCSRYVLGGCEQITSGISRMALRESHDKLHFPMIASNDANCKRLIDNRFGSGQAVWEAIMHTTNLSIAGKTVVVAGFGNSGSGIAQCAQGLGAKVIVTEIDPVRAIEATMQGFSVMSMDSAAACGDIFITATNSANVLQDKHFASMKACVLLCNAGRQDVEINIKHLSAMSTEVTKVRPQVQGFRMKDGRTICLLSDGRHVGLSAGQGHPIEMADMSYAILTMSLLYLSEHGEQMPSRVYNVPKEIDRFVARLKLSSMGINIDQ